MMEQTRRRALLVPGLALVASLAVAQDAGVGHRCAAIGDDSARLACYDAEFGRPVAATTAAPASNARVDFGLTEAEKRALDPARPEAPSSITAKVAATSKRPTGEWVVTLEDGQVWVQAESDTRAVLKTGDEVTIRKAALGSFVLVSANRVAMRVRRIK